MKRRRGRTRGRARARPVYLGGLRVTPLSVEERAAALELEERIRDEWAAAGYDAAAIPWDRLIG